MEPFQVVGGILAAEQIALAETEIGYPVVVGTDLFADVAAADIFLVVEWSSVEGETTAAEAEEAFCLVVLQLCSYWPFDD